MLVNKLKTYLDVSGVKFVTIQHSAAFTAQEIADSAHISGKELVKTVIVRVGDELAMVVLPASEMVDCSTISKVAGGAVVCLADEDEFSSQFPDCEIGAMPPFGNLYGMKVFQSRALAEDDEIAFNACSHTELIKMKYADFERLTGPATVLYP